MQSTGKPEEIFLSGSDPRIPQTVEVLSIENRSVQYALLSCGYVEPSPPTRQAFCNT